MAEKDWCAEADALRQVRRDLATGMAVSQVTYDDRSVSYTKADIKHLDSLIAEADALCSLQARGTVKRRRYAMGARFKSY